ncbi:MAG: radical SAM protein [Fibrobacterota bacterium]
MKNTDPYEENKFHLRGEWARVYDHFSTRFTWSYQGRRELQVILKELQMWGIDSSLVSDLSAVCAEKLTEKQKTQRVLDRLRRLWRGLKQSPTDYPENAPVRQGNSPVHITYRRIPGSILGDCPVASEKTRCCNLKTLDAVIRCGFDCSYCSIQSFYTGGEVLFQPDLAERLAALDLSKDKIWHIGTGQSSDSLMWGNRDGLLEKLMAFARARENVILELKTKSREISWLMKHSVPSNVIVTWSLNPQVIIDHEEHGTASLKERLDAAEMLSKKGVAVGFHFHPMVWIENWRGEYGQIFSELQKRFDPRAVAMVSLGTLTFIKPVLKKIRNRAFYSKILQMPLEEIAGRFSYPRHIKKDLFSFAYERFSAAWKENVFFYMCMEDKTLWKDVFGFEYGDNNEFEEAMTKQYKAKTEQLKRLK